MSIRTKYGETKPNPNSQGSKNLRKQHPLPRKPYGPKPAAPITGWPKNPITIRPVDGPIRAIALGPKAVIPKHHRGLISERWPTGTKPPK